MDSDPDPAPFPTAVRQIPHPPDIPRDVSPEPVQVQTLEPVTLREDDVPFNPQGSDYEWPALSI